MAQPLKPPRRPSTSNSRCTRLRSVSIDGSIDDGEEAESEDPRKAVTIKRSAVNIEVSSSGCKDGWVETADVAAGATFMGLSNDQAAGERWSQERPSEHDRACYHVRDGMTALPTSRSLFFVPLHMRHMRTPGTSPAVRAQPNVTKGATIASTREIQSIAMTSSSPLPLAPIIRPAERFSSSLEEELAAITAGEG